MGVTGQRVLSPEERDERLESEMRGRIRKGLAGDPKAAGELDEN